MVIAPGYEEEALTLLKAKKNRILLVQKETALPKKQYRTALNGVLCQEKDPITDTADICRSVTKNTPSDDQLKDLLFASRISKHTKSNTIVLVKNNQLCASGTGQTSRVDALNQAIAKAKNFDFDVDLAVLASDAFFPFPDCLEFAHNAGITAVIQPGGSVKDQQSIDFCDAHKMSMIFTGVRHFKH